MKPFLHNSLGGLRDAMQRRRQQRASGKTLSADILQTVESVVDSTDARIRLVSGYQKRLASNIGSALDFADGLVNQFPAAIEVNHSTFVSNPHVNAFFANVNDLQTIFSHSSEIRDFMEDISYEEVPECSALLCMRMTEKTVMGMELSGDMLKRDVRQTAVSFSDHRIYSPAPSESATRAGLKKCLFEGLVTNALEHIVKRRMTHHHLQSRHRILHSRQRRLEQKIHDAGLHSGSDMMRELEETRQELKGIEKDMLANRVVTPQQSLEQVVEIFSQPLDFIKTRRFSLVLNKMGIKTERGSGQACNEIDLTEVSIRNEPPRVVTLARFPRDELLPQRSFGIAGGFSPPRPA